MTVRIYTSSTSIALFLLLSLFCLVNPAPLGAKEYTFSWSANPDPVEGYYLYYKKGGKASLPLEGDDAEEGPSPIDVENLTTFTITGLEPYETYHFALTAYNGDTESDYTPVITVVPDQLHAVATQVSYGGQTPLIVEFTGTASTGDIERYFWEFGDGVISSIANPSHIYSLPGSYTAKLTVTDSTGNSDMATLVIAASDSAPQPADPPTAVITPANPAGQAPLTLSFSGSSSSSPHPPLTSYIWDFGDGQISEVASPTHTYPMAGTYTVSLIVSDSTGEINQVSVPVIVTTDPNLQNDPPTAMLDADPLEGKPPLTVSYDATDSFDPDGSIYLHYINFGDGSASYSSSGQHKYTDFGDYTLTLVVIDNNGATSSITTRVSVNSKSDSSKEISFDGIVSIIKYLLLNNPD